MSKLRCAVIGLGMGRAHASVYAAFPGAELVAVSDLNAEQFVKVKGLLGADRCFTDYREMLRVARPDIVSVALPNFLHLPVTIDCLEAGAHVLCEKPPAMNLKDALKMRDASLKYNRALGIHFSQRYRYMKIKQQLAEGAFGDFYHARVQWTRRDGAPGFGGWFGQKALSGGGPLIDLGVHRIDLAMWLMGNPRPTSVSGALHGQIGEKRAHLENKVFDVEDFSTGFIRFAGGESLIFEASWIGHQGTKETQQMYLLGTEAALEQREQQWWKHAIDVEGAYSRELEFSVTSVLPSVEAFVESVATQQPYGASIEDGLRIQAILDALYKSAAESREIEIPENLFN